MRIPIWVEILLLLNKRLKNSAISGIITQDSRIKPRHRERFNPAFKYISLIFLNIVHETYPFGQEFV